MYRFYQEVLGMLRPVRKSQAQKELEFLSKKSFAPVSDDTIIKGFILFVQELADLYQMPRLRLAATQTLLWRLDQSPVLGTKLAHFLRTLAMWSRDDQEAEMASALFLILLSIRKADALYVVRGTRHLVSTTQWDRLIQLISS